MKRSLRGFSFSSSSPLPSLVAIAVAVALPVAACSGKGDSANTAPAPSATDGGAADAEAGPAPLPVRPPCPIEDGCRAVRPADVTVLATGAIHMPAGAVVLADGSIAAFGSRWDDRKLVVAQGGGKTFAPAIALPWSPSGDGTSVAPRGATDGATDGAIYFTSSYQGSALYRSRVGTDGSRSEPEKITLNGSPVVPSWPQATRLPDGRVLLAFTEPQKRAFLAVSDASGLTFDVKPAPVTAGELRGVLAHVGTTKQGKWVLTHQVADASWLFTSYVQTSSDGGATWSQPTNIVPQDPNVHDAFVVTRIDDGADLYYLHAGADGDLNVHRRALREDGTLGPEQIVTTPEVGHTEKPQPRRLPDGRLAMTMALRRSDKAYDLVVATLDGDAPP
jgi:hypothetical protein